MARVEASAPLPRRSTAAPAALETSERAVLAATVCQQPPPALEVLYRREARVEEAVAARMLRITTGPAVLVAHST
jgi:predicted alpha/beta hydrolase family esterase